MMTRVAMVAGKKTGGRLCWPLLGKLGLSLEFQNNKTRQKEVTGRRSLNRSPPPQLSLAEDGRGRVSKTRERFSPRFARGGCGGLFLCFWSHPAHARVVSMPQRALTFSTSHQQAEHRLSVTIALMAGTRVQKNWRTQQKKLTDLTLFKTEPAYCVLP